MSVPVVLFIILATVICVSALGVVIAQSVVRAAVWLLFTLIGIAGIYLLLGAEFLGASQLIVYVGGTLVLMVFGVMITNEGPFAVLKTTAVQWILAVVFGLALFALLTALTLQMSWPTSGDTNQPLPGIHQLGLGFLGVPGNETIRDDSAVKTDTAYLLPFEIISVHLLVVLIGAAYLARAKRRMPTVQPALVEDPEHD